MITKSFYRFKKSNDKYMIYYSVYYSDGTYPRRAGVKYQINLSEHLSRSDLANEVIRVKHLMKTPVMLFIWKHLRKPSLQQIKDLNNYLALALI